MPIEHHVGYYKPEQDEDVTWVLPPPWSRDDQGVAAKLLGALEYSATGYFGNEGSDAAFYVSAALLVDVPSARTRRAS